VRKERKKKKYHSLIFKVWNWKNLNEIQRLLREDRYLPDPVKRVSISKPDGRRMPLGIPTIRDRVVQQALKNVLEPIFEAEFVDSIRLYSILLYDLSEHNPMKNLVTHQHSGYPTAFTLIYIL